MKTEERVETLEGLNQWLAPYSMKGLWTLPRTMPRSEPRPWGVPHLWKWGPVRVGLDHAQRIVEMDTPDRRHPEYDVGRRDIYFSNPALFNSGGSTTPTMAMGIQMVMPGEVALDHRHTISAIRFIIEGEVGAYTVVEGEKCTMERGDFILTPNWLWHGHHNHTDKPVLWVDGLDAPLIHRGLNATFIEQRVEEPTGMGPLVSEVDHAVRRPGELLPPGARGERLVYRRLVYKWRDTLPALESMVREDRSPFDGRLLQYRNTAAGGYTLPTMNCWIQMLSPGEETGEHRHTYNHIFHVFEGRGVTEVDGDQFQWEQGDTLVVPNWMWHRHQNASGTEPAILFSMNDLPPLETFGLLREETR